MAAIKKNIWLIFYIILLAGACLSVALSLYAYRETMKDATATQEAHVNMAAISVNAHLEQYNSMFSAMSQFLLRNNNYRAPLLARSIFSDIMQSSPSIMDIGLFNIDGSQFMSTVSPGNKVDISTSPSFEEYISSQGMVIGRPFKDRNLNEYYIPLAKTLRDVDGKPLTIIVVALSTEDGFVFVNRANSKTAMERASIVLAPSYHYLTVPYDNQSDINPYSDPIPKQTITAYSQAVAEKHGQTFDEIKQSEQVTSIIAELPRVNREALLSTEYIKTFDLWVNMYTPINEVHQRAIPNILSIWATFLTLTIALYLLFRTIYRFEEQKRAELNYQANHDYLTGLYNRYYLSTIKHDLDTPEHPYWILSLDINSFRSINNNFGHLNGDQLLKQIALRLRTECGNELIVRYSGDEFLIISHGSEFEVFKLAKTLNRALEQPFELCSHQFQFHCNLGMAKYPKHGSDLEQVKQRANLARYESKQKQHQIIQFSSKIKERYQQLFAMETALGKAIEDESIYMVYQPQVNAEGELTGVESLVRWEDDELGFVPPDKFIAVAEKTDLMPKLGQLIVKKSLQDFLELRAHSEYPFTTSINISAVQFMQADFAEQLVKVVHEHCVSPHEITLEITESIFIEDTAYVLDQILTLKQHGFAIALDDFGTGFSSLSMLSQLPLDELKLDKSFIDPIVNHQTSEKMLVNIIRIGKDLNLKLVAEGVEDEEQKRILQQYECDLYQGYYFSRPLKKDDLISYFANHSHFPAY